MVGEDGVSRGRCQGRKEVTWMLSNLGGPRRMRVISDGGQQLSTSYYVTMNGRGKRTMTFVNNLTMVGRWVFFPSSDGRLSFVPSLLVV